MGEFQIEYAKRYIALGLTPIPLEKGKKNPNTLDWLSKPDYSTPELITKAFSGETNIGILLGTISSGFIDIDLDTIEAVRLAPTFLPVTGFKWGRVSKPISHWGYFVKEETKRIQFVDPLIKPSQDSKEKNMILEIRGNGTQTAVPPSVHQGETVQFYGQDNPSTVDLAELQSSAGLLATAAFFARHWNDYGSRHTLAMQLAGALCRSKWAEESVDRFITAIATAAQDEEVEDRRRTVRDTYVRDENDDPSTGWPTLRETLGDEAIRTIRSWLGIVEINQYPMNDIGNAQRFIDIHGADVRFCAEMKTWLVWDGRQWQIDLSGVLVGSKTLSIPRVLLQEAANEPNPDRQKQLAKWALQSGIVNRISAIPQIAQDISTCWIDAEALDQNIYKLNCPNGILDLITGGLEKPHNKNEYLTRMAGASYNPKAHAPRFTYFLEQIFAGNEVLIKYIQKLAGYCLTGSMDEQIFPILFGKGANGKSTLLEILRAVWGDYSQVASPASFLQTNSDRIRSDIARMKGARLIVSTEVSQNRQLDTSIVKSITGGDKITARFLFKNDFEFSPTGKIMMATNYKPEISGDDGGMWRRIRLIPFEVVIPDDQQDLGLKQRIMESEKEGVLTWAVEGCMAWQREGLGNPEEVLAATATYKEDSDTVQHFVADSCEVGSGFRCTAKALYSAYQTWCKASGVRYDTMVHFRDNLVRLGYHPLKMGSTVEWVGISPLASLEPSEPDPQMIQNPFAP